MRLDVLLFFIVFNFNELPHPPYSPDLAPSDFHLFRSLQWFLRDKTLETEGEVKSALNDFLLLKTLVFIKEESIVSFKSGKMLSKKASI